MKKTGLYLLVVFLFSAGSSFQQSMAQEKSKEEKEKEIKIQQTIDLQKKAMTREKKAQEEALQNLEDNLDETDSILKNIEVEIDVDSEDGPKDIHRVFKRRVDRSFDIDDPFILSPGMEPLFGTSFNKDTESTTWELSKSVKENSLSRDYAFDVEKSARSVVMSVMGDCKSGEIRVRIVMPNGKTYSDIVIDEFGSLNWRKSFTISETENQDKSGEWKFQIASKNATGYFKISLRTY